MMALMMKRVMRLRRTVAMASRMYVHRGIAGPPIGTLAWCRCAVMTEEVGGWCPSSDVECCTDVCAILWCWGWGWVCGTPFCKTHACSRALKVCHNVVVWA